jgi:hypothetical protein
MVNWKSVANRLKEPSTWAGLGVLAGVLGLPVTPAEWQAIVQVITAAAGAAAVFMGERGNGA